MFADGSVMKLDIKEVSVVVIIPCHFRNKGTLCETTNRRIRKALAFLEGRRNPVVILTGDVPYRPGGATLDELMEKKIAELGFKGDVLPLTGDYGMFSEARHVASFVGHADWNNFAVVSSPWYLFYAAPVWKRRAKERGADVKFVSVWGTGGWRTWLTYIALGIVVRVAILLGKERVLEERMTRYQSGRMRGFTFDGCR